MKSSVTTRSKQKTTGAHPGGFSKRDVNRFLKESNRIEQEMSDIAFADAQAAWAFLEDKDRMTPSVILCIHDLLMKNIDKDIAGDWRDCPVMIGGRVVPYVSQALIEDEVKRLCTQIMHSIEEKINVSQDLHIAFEYIHPFTDGNGRVGRIIYNWHRLKLGLPIHIIKADWPKKNGEQMTYYSWFKK